MEFTKSVGLLVILVIASCAPSQEMRTSRIASLTEDLQKFQTNPEIISFLAQEAANAGVRRIIPFSGTDTGRVKRSPAYGMARSSDKTVLLDAGSAGGRSVVNITHEIAHFYAFGSACSGHSSKWLNAYLEIAKRYEARFPGARWSRTTPTKRVMRNVQRYGIGTRCR